MRRRYWLTASVMTLLGLVFCFLVYGYRFTGLVLLGAAGVCWLFGLMSLLKPRLPRLMRAAQTVLCILLALAILTAFVTGIAIIRAGSGSDDIDSDYLIVLGAGVNGTTPSRSLYERLTAAEEYLRRHPNTVAILSGGMGDQENITEAACMYAWLTQRGIAPDRLRMEERATSTQENIRFSLDLIEKETGVRPTKCAVLSSSYHLYRACLLSRKEGLQMQAVSAHVAFPYYCNMLLREIFGVLYTQVFL